MPGARFADLLELLADREVEFIIVGMTAGVLAGAPVTTLDVDIVHRRTPENVARLLEALRDIGAVYRHDSRGLVPTDKHLLSPGHQLLATSYADLDCLGTIDGGRGYDELLQEARKIRLRTGRTVFALDLPALIEIKKRLARPKDLAVIPLLEATLDERRRQEGD